MAERYTSVLPEPVTPSTRTTSPWASRRARSICASACLQPLVSATGALPLAEDGVVCSLQPRQARRSYHHDAALFRAP